ncbi:MAG: ABC transporter ATP-binding protein [Coriobacteriia bacterium]|nr:ABC transporter ATP-binding protein [Coriobacteriia bacterium]
MAEIVLDTVTKTYPGITSPAVDALSLEIKAGSVVTLLGPSGCGKTTTLRLIAGFERPDAGSISIGEATVAGPTAWVPPERRGVGMVFQEHALFPHLDVASNVGFNLPRAERAERVAETLELVDLAGYDRRMPHELSGGQQQRVALARALAARPLVVLLDEPFASLDADLRVHMRAEVRRILAEAGTTAVFVSHDQSDALAISDTIVVMRDGRIEQVGSPREIYQFPHTRFVAEFVGRTNLLAGRIGEDGDSVVTDIGVAPCRHTHDLPPGTPVTVSVRADSLELDAEGPLRGVVREATYTGRSIDAMVEIQLADGGTADVLVHAHPEQVITCGDEVRFRVLPEFVAVIGEGGPG